MPARVAHPAKFSSALLPAIDDLLRGATVVLDPMAGLGGLRAVRRDAYLNELEPEWAAYCGYPGDPRVTCLDARDLPYPDGFFDGIATSPAYGNRMADGYAGDKRGSKRHTYRVALGRPLSAGSGAALQWGEAYRSLHTAVWQECCRLLRPSGVLVLNVSDHIRSGVRVPVSSWHCSALEDVGFRLDKIREIETPRNRCGSNAALRVGHESVYRFVRA